MARTWGQIQKECDRAIPLADGRWVGYIMSSYQIILNLRQWLGLRSTYRLTTIPALFAGTVSVAQGATAVTGVGTGWDSTLTRMQILIGEGVESYAITITSPTTAELDRPFEGEAAVDVSYKIFRTNYALPLDLKSVSRIIRPGHKEPLKMISRGDLLAQGVWFGDPDKWANGLPAGTDPAYKTIDLSPSPDIEIALSVEYQVAPVHFTGRNSQDYPLDFVSDDAIILMAKMLAAADLPGRDPNVYKDFYQEAIKSMHEAENQRIGEIQTEPSEEFNEANASRLEYQSW